MVLIGFCRAAQGIERVCRGGAWKPFTQPRVEDFSVDVVPATVMWDLEHPKPGQLQTDVWPIFGSLSEAIAAGIASQHDSLTADVGVLNDAHLILGACPFNRKVFMEPRSFDQVRHGL
ncbi:MAG: hypothetical protein B7Z52_03770 [Burkholderiales bacterium 12-64-5]|nr:MAG: hypothetical protein B7Z52_03770 [Burkholderiales bacterium 12-64-5]